MEQISNSEKKPINELDFGDEDESSSGSEIKINYVARTIFMDEDEESDDDETLPKKITAKQIVISTVEPIIGDRCMTEYIFPDANNYSFKSWQQCFPDNKIILQKLIFNPGWNNFFNIIGKKPYFKKMENILSDCLSKSNETMLPYAELVFNTFNVLAPKQISVVLIGQDPYPGAHKINNKIIPQAMGFSFSVPLNFPKPESLKNIYNNMLFYNHIRKIPDSGCLSSLVIQGCFMINAALTTCYNKKNVHKNIWKRFTDDLLAYINKNCENVVFLVWGKDAHMMCKFIDPNKHCIITSSHPSPLGFNKTFNGYAYGPIKNEKDRKEVTYPSFQTIDHFGRVNTYLKSVGKREIFWDLIN
jgi:uracil-DNA glycosylase